MHTLQNSFATGAAQRQVTFVYLHFAILKNIFVRNVNKSDVDEERELERAGEKMFCMFCVFNYQLD